MYENLKPGDYVPGKGYFHLCAFLKCTNPPFFGRKNQKYHSDCKKRNDAQWVAIKREKTKEENKIMAENLSILEEFYPRSLGINEIPEMELRIKGYDFQAPSRRVKTEQYGYECYILHNYAFRYINNNHSVIIYKKDELYNL